MRSARSLLGLVVVSASLVTVPGMAASASAAPTIIAYRVSVVAGRPRVAEGAPATDSDISASSVATDSSGNVYFADGGHVDKVAPNGILTVVAGVVGFSPPAGTTTIAPVPGPALASPMNPRGLTVDAVGDLYIADALGFVDKVTPDGTLSIVAGIGSAQVYDGPIAGPAMSSPMRPTDVAVDPSGNLFIADGLGEIEKVTPDGTLSIVASYGQLGSQPAGTFQTVSLGGIALDSAGNVYVTDVAAVRTTGYVFKVTPSGTVSIVAGNGQPGTVGTPGSATGTAILPYDVAVDPAGALYIATRNGPGSDQIGHVVKVTPDGAISTVAGSPGFGPSEPGYSPVPGPATSSPMSPLAVALDSAGSLYIGDDGFTGDYSGFVEKVTPGGTLSVLAGDTNNTPVPGPATHSPTNANDVAIDGAGNLYLADPAGYVEKVAPNGTLSIFAGRGDTADAPQPGSATSSPMIPRSVAVSSAGNVYVADSRGYILKITSAGVLSVLIGPGYTTQPSSGIGPDYPTQPVAVAVDASENVYVADHTGYVEKVTPAGAISVVAGDGDSSSPPLGPTATSTQMVPTGVAVDASGNLFISTWDCYVYKVTPDGTPSIVAGNSNSYCTLNPADVTVDPSGNLYIADSAGYVERVAPNGSQTTIAGTPTTAPPTNSGWATSSAISPLGISVDSTGHVYVANQGYPDNDVVKLTPTSASAPSSPTNVVAKAGSSSATVSFTPSLDTGGSPVTNYTVTDGAGHTCTPTTMTNYGAGNTSCTVNGLVPGASYTFTVTATNAVGTSVASQPSNSVTPYTYPSAPRDVTATAGPASADIAWTVPASDGWAPIVGYRVTATDTSNANITSSVCPNSSTSTATSCAATGLTNGHTYTFTVVAWNAAGNGPASSASPMVTPLAPPDAPASTMITAGDGSVTPSWYAPGDGGSPITRYTATAEPGGATCVTPGGGSPNHCTITGLTNGVTYTVTVTATNTVGTSAPGNAVSATPEPSPPTITNTARPTIAGTVRVGVRLTASAGTWSATGLTYQYQWLANNVEISGATASTFSPTATQLSKTLTIVVTASRTGYNSGWAASAATTAVARGVIANKTLPTIAGTKRVGYTLTASVGTWSPTGLTYRYQWFRGSTAIKGAIYRTLKLSRAFHGYRIRVRVTASRTGYTSVARFSAYTVSIR